MMTHTVLFWANDDLTAAQLKDFEEGLRTLLRISWVSEGWIGTPSASNRKVVDRSYTFALLLRFKDLAAHDAYQVDPVHDAFHTRCVKYWSRVVVYDFDDVQG
jgi:hypothetical protein